MKKLLLILIFISTNIFSQITFDADFESGNLKSVSTTDSVTYYVETHSDIGGRWFYFRINGVKNKFIRVEIVTSPADFSRAMYSYDDINYERFSETESPSFGVFEKEFIEDTVYVAYYTPYTYQMLQENLEQWKENEYVKLDTIGYTQNLFPLQEMIVTDHAIDNSEKLNVWIHARTHPGETPSSWQFDGIVRELLSNDEVINYYLSKIKFHLIPFTNPDGVYFGRSRTNFDYVDVEREWDKPDAETCLEAIALKKRMKEINDEKPFSVFLNLHSQAASYCTFWIHYADGTSADFFDSEMQFSYLNVSDNPYFTPSDFSYSTLKSYFPEGWLWNNYGEDVMALTYETPYDYYHENKDSMWVTNENLQAIGKRTIYAIAEYLEINHPKHYIMDNNIAEVLGFSSNYDVGNEYFGDDFIVLDQSDQNSYAVFNSEVLPSGKYDVSAWWPHSEGNSTNTEIIINSGTKIDTVYKTQKANEAQWNYLVSIELSSSSQVTIRVNNNSSGLVIADAFRLRHYGQVTSVKNIELPNEFVLEQNYPNPFNPSTTIRYSVPALSDNHQNVSLIVYNLLGEIVSTLVNEYQSPGQYETEFNIADVNKNLASGPYFYRLNIGEFSKTKKMVLVK